MNRRSSILRSFGLIASAITVPKLSAFAEASTSKKSFRIAHITDVHMMPLIGASKGFAKCLHHIQNLEQQPDLILNSGDSIMDAHRGGRSVAEKQWKLWHDVLKNELSVPIVQSLGNHDIWCKSENVASIEDGKKWALDELKESHRYYSKDLGIWHLISLDSISPDKDGRWYTGKIDEEQMDWLKNELAQIPANKPTMIVSHIPILSACIFFDGKRFEKNQWNIPGKWMHEDASDLKDLFFKYPNVKLAISGHIHLLDRVEYNGISYCCNGAVSGAWWGGNYQQTQPGYAIIDLFSDGTFTNNYQTYTT
jgi:3',5'-cyclic AMP phosphodiesterase CpdA